MNLNKAMSEKGWTPTEAAAACGVSYATFNKWRNRSAGRPGSLPWGEAGKSLELAFNVRDFRMFFPSDWPELADNEDDGR